jgi:hypothetical protein
MNQLMFKPISHHLPLFPDHSSYIEYCLEMVVSMVRSYDSISDLENNLGTANAYARLNALEKPKNLIQLDDNTLNNSDYLKAWRCIVDGKLFVEHHVAGEATRLKLGTKYLIDIQKDLSFNKITDLINQEKRTCLPKNYIQMHTLCNPSDLLPLSLGVRHMLQYSYDIYKLSKRLGYDPFEVFSKQKMLIVLNEAAADIIIDEFIKHKFYGFSQQNILFMIQKAYHGISLKYDEIFYDNLTTKHLHNHGHIAIQQTMHNQIFYTSTNKNRYYLSNDQFGNILKDMDVKTSYNIEDLEYLNSSIDYQGLALALKKSKDGYNMLMEVLPNNPDAPQKGGMAAFDPFLEKDVMIENFQLNHIKPDQIKFLNKNVNYYPKPFVAWEMVKKYGLNMHITVKGDYIYFQPVIGDINFLVKTAIFTRKNATPIKAWKSAITTPLTINFMYKQDLQKGFKEYALKFLRFRE